MITGGGEQNPISAAPKPPEKRYGDIITVGLGQVMVIADMDFETYSEAGFVYDTVKQTWGGLLSNSNGIGAVGAAAYSEHASTDCLSLAYDLKDGNGRKLWIPGLPAPMDLFKHLADGKLVEAHNAAFEVFIWNNVCRRLFGWPELPTGQVRCSMAKAKAFGLPGALKFIGEILNIKDKKLEDGKRLIKKFSCPKKPTKKDPRLRIKPGVDEYEDTAKLYEYNLFDIKSESQVAEMIPDLSPLELELWQVDQEINQRGIHVDSESLDSIIYIIEENSKRLLEELQIITNNEVTTAKQTIEMIRWCNARGMELTSVAADHVQTALDDPNTPTDCRKVLEIRQALASASVNKVYKIKAQMCRDSTIKDQYRYCGGERTGRFSAEGVQVHNLPSKGPYKSWTVEDVEKALNIVKMRDYDLFKAAYSDVNTLDVLIGCLRGLLSAPEGYDLICSDFSSIEAVVLAMLAGDQKRIDVFRRGECIYEYAAAQISGIPLKEIQQHRIDHGVEHPLRKSLGKISELACLGQDTLVLTDSGWKKIIDVYPSDAIYDGENFVYHEGVVKKGDRFCIDFHGVSMTPNHKIWCGGLEWEESERVLKDDYLSNECFARTKNLLAKTNVPPIPSFRPRPHSKNVNKPVFDILNAGPRNRFVINTKKGPLIVHNSGFGGGVGSWKQFGADKHFNNDDEIKTALKRWRQLAKPTVDFWYNLQRAAHSAILNPGKAYTVGLLTYGMVENILYCKLPSGRFLHYHDPQLHPDTTPWGTPTQKMSYMGWNSDRSKGSYGWIRISTWHGKLVENVVQAVARDIQGFSMININKAGYPIVLHTHDEICSEVPEGFGSIEEFESIMGTLPDWAKDWPIRATGGWRGKRYRKD